MSWMNSSAIFSSSAIIPSTRLRLMRLACHCCNLQVNFPETFSICNLMKTILKIWIESFRYWKQLEIPTRSRKLAQSVKNLDKCSIIMLNFAIIRFIALHANRLTFLAILFLLRFFSEFSVIFLSKFTFWLLLNTDSSPWVKGLGDYRKLINFCMNELFGVSGFNFRCGWSHQTVHIITGHPFDAIFDRSVSWEKVVKT